MPPAVLAVSVELDRLLGDSLLLEPALFAWAERNAGQVELYNPTPSAALYREHPSITLVDRPGPGSRTLSCWTAFRWSLRRGIYFAAGYFPQLGLEIDPSDRIHFRLYGTAGEVPEAVAALGDRYVAIAPFSVSCESGQGRRANKAAPLDWWGPIIERCPWPVVSLGARGDPPVPGTLELRGLNLRTVAGVMARSAAFVTVETGLLHLAGGVCDQIVYLNSATGTPPFFCTPPRPGINVEVVRARHPELWPHGRVLEAIQQAAGAG